MAAAAATVARCAR